MEHNIKPAEPPKETPRRPDLSTFFSTLSQVDTSGSNAPRNANSIPEPGQVSAAYRTLAHAFQMMQGGRPDEPNSALPTTTTTTTDSPLLSFLVQSLLSDAEDPPRKVEGVSDEYLSGLERIPKARLKPDDSCPICSNAFLEDSHPLVVRLPCKGEHVFDLDCIAPWLKLNPTCPMDRQRLVKSEEEKARERERLRKEAEEEEGEYDDMYA